MSRYADSGQRTAGTGTGTEQGYAGSYGAIRVKVPEYAGTCRPNGGIGHA
jgi:PDZ domain-containing secreted protein